MYKQDSALNKLSCLIHYKTQTNPTKRCKVIKNQLSVFNFNVLETIESHLGMYIFHLEKHENL